LFPSRNLFIRFFYFISKNTRQNVLRSTFLKLKAK